MDTYQTAGTPPAGNGTTEVAREQAAAVGQHAASAGGDLAQTTKEQGREVVAETSRQARDLAQEARTQLREQSVAQRDRATGSLRALGDELEQMAQRGGQSGTATEIAHQAAGRVRDVARFLENREPGDLVEEVRSYARRRPGTFLAGAAVAGVLVGRVMKASRGAQPDTASGPAGPSGSDGRSGSASPSGPDGAGTGRPAVPVQSGYPAPAAPPIQPEPGYGTAGYPTGAAPGRTP
ncbi:MAG: hypothetical protein V7637_6667 [Mycobacteriales bacterium]|jgi:hypothetical protein